MYGTHDGLGAHRAGLEPSDAVSHGVGRAERIPSCCRWRQSRGAQRPRRIGERDEWAAPGTGDGLARSRFPRARLRPSWAHIDQRGLHPHATRRQPVTQLAGHDPGGQVRSALSLEPPKQDLRPPAHRPWPLQLADWALSRCRRQPTRSIGRREGKARLASRPGRLYGRPCAIDRADPTPCDGSRAASRRRHHPPRVGQGQGDHRAIVDLCARRLSVRRAAARGCQGERKSVVFGEKLARAYAS